jgi:pSer/pThr/pTyr-binding forkhead associated (FHA) protein
LEQAFLQIVAGARRGLNIPIPPDRPLVVGRKRGELILDDPLVSGAHCQVARREGKWVLQDLGSTNGTLVNGKLVQREIVLQPGAEISIGGNRMLLYVGDEAPDSGEGGNGIALEIAWLLDEELVELRNPGEKRAAADVISQDLRLPPGLNAAIEVVAGQDAGKVFRVTRSGNVSVGRRQGDVPLTDVEVSRHHAVIEVFGREMIFLRDLGSTNGSYHNGRRITSTRIQASDTVGCGKTVMKLLISR